MNQGYVYLIGGEACWQEVKDQIQAFDALLSEQVEAMEEQGVKIEVEGFPTYEQYVELRDMISSYTDGHLIVTSWRWNAGAVTPGQSAGLCIGDPESAANYWSCWEYVMGENMEYDDMPRSYLVNPAEFTESSRLDQFTDISREAFPAMFGSWICLPPMTYDNGTYSNCARFLPSEESSRPEDFKFSRGPVNVMTYLTSRAEAVLANGNETMVTENPMLESFILNLSGGISGISAAAMALTAAVAALNF